MLIHYNSQPVLGILFNIDFFHQGYVNVICPSNLYLLTQSVLWLQRLDLNQRPLGYEPSELPNCYHSAIYLFDNLQTNIMIVSCRKLSHLSLTVVLQNSRRRKISLNINDTHNLCARRYRTSSVNLCYLGANLGQI